MIEDKIIQYCTNKTISCTKAFIAASELDIELLELGNLFDKMGIQISMCQLGLFGYHEHEKNIPSIEKDDNFIREEITKALQNGKLSCKQAWKIADKRKIKRSLITAYCEEMSIKISNCQLGAFGVKKK